MCDEQARLAVAPRCRQPHANPIAGTARQHGKLALPVDEQVW